MRHASTLLEVLGMVLLVVAAYFVDWRLAVAVGGIVLLVAGYALDRPAPSREVDG